MHILGKSGLSRWLEYVVVAMFGCGAAATLALPLLVG